MRRSYLGFVIWLGAGLFGPASGRAAEILVLASSVTVADGVVTAGDLASNPLSDGLSSVILYDAPQPGHQLRIQAKDLLRRFVQVGARDVPRVQGAEQIVVRRDGRELDSVELGAALAAQLQTIPLPLGAIDQRWEILSTPRLYSDRSSLRVRILDPGPVVGRGTVRIQVGPRRGFVSVRRGLRAVGLRLELPARTGADLGMASLRPDTLWVASQVDWDQLRRADEARGGWSFTRQVKAGAVLRRGDLRPAYLVHRGQMVQWQVRRGELEVRSTVRARSDGALGDWILVQSPFDHRLRRVCVVGPGAVAATAPEPVSSASTSFPAETSGGRP